MTAATSRPAPAAAATAIELVITSYDRLAVLEETLRAVRRLYPDLPICLGLQGPEPDERFGAWLERDPLIRIERLPEPSPTRSINHCVATSGADLVLILDDDAQPCQGWLEAHQRAFAEDPTLVYACGREVRLTKGRPAVSELVRIAVELGYGLFLGRDKKINGRIAGWASPLGLLFGNYDLPGSCRINSPRACNMAVRRDAFIEAGAFAADYRGNVCWGFEADLGLRLAARGRLGLYIGDAVVLHAETPSGGTRQTARGTAWFWDFLHNHAVLMRTLGPQGWIGSAPRLVRRLLQVGLVRAGSGGGPGGAPR